MLFADRYDFTADINRALARKGFTTRVGGKKECYESCQDTVYGDLHLKFTDGLVLGDLGDDYALEIKDYDDGSKEYEIFIFADGKKHKVYDSKEATRRFSSKECLEYLASIFIKKNMTTQVKNLSRYARSVEGCIKTQIYVTDTLKDFNPWAEEKAN